ncbi:MAG: PEP-CTERM sorting domain-containing protein [Chthonomonadaceae bacterium]|nr:PEP-CTERM sorting domain-containing protein [Chthonomonadaceae bacterium]
MRKTFLTSIALLVSGLAVGQTFYGPTTYVQASDSPFWGISGLLIEDAEDHLFDDLIGATCNFTRLSSSFGTSLIDSVDADDGVINGASNDGGNPAHYGEAFWRSGSMTITFGNGGAPLPTYAGLVWTDGSGTITFEAFGAGHVSLGTVVGNHADGNFQGGTAEDRFYGVHFAAGIESMTISNPSGIEVDHVQAVYSPVPEPTTLALAGLALGAAARRVRRRKR